MDLSSAVQHHQQEVCSETLESMLVSTKAHQEMKKPRPAEQTVKCPRCDSSNTKFCYYNNYSLSQPRYFCKSCRRYWTQGGTLRNVPVGGGCRKNKRTSSKTSTSQDHSINTNPNPLSPLTPFSYDSGDLSLAFARLQKQTSSGNLGIENHIGHFGEHGTGNFLDALRGGFLENVPNGFNQNFYYGVENGGMGMHNYDQEMTTTTATSTVTTVKQEMGREGDNNRVLWGFPWQINGDGNNNMGDFDSTKRIWNGVSFWHGLLNTPLM